MIDQGRRGGAEYERAEAERARGAGEQGRERSELVRQYEELGTLARMMRRARELGPST